jgi:folate-binding protein YgfZ
LFLTAKGKVLADFLLALLPDRVEMVGPPAARAALRDGLGRYVISDDAVLEDRSEAAGLLSLVGPRAEAAAGRVLGAALPAARPGAADLSGPGGRVTAILRTRAGLPAVDLLAAAAALPGLRKAALAAAAAEGGGILGPDSLEALRVEAGEPALGAEAGEDTLPQECGLADAVSFTKGCFLGQEPVGRLQTRGHTNRGLAGLLLPPGSPVPARGDAVLLVERETGFVTSACFSPGLGRPIALGILRHEAGSPGTALQLRTAAGPLSCEVSGLPFIR